MKIEATYTIADLDLVIEVFFNGTRYGVRMVNTDCGEDLGIIRFFNNLDLAKAYAEAAYTRAA